MVVLVLVLLLISIVSGVFGFTDISVATSGIAKIIFWIFTGLFLISLTLLFSGVALSAGI